MGKPLRLAIIGTGLIVEGRHWPALQALQRDFHVVALVNRTPEKAEKLAAVIRQATRQQPTVYTDYRQMLAQERPDAVSLALPTLLNPEVTQAALAAGCHVLAEKPIAASLTAARGMLDWPARYGKTLMIAENYRYVASFQRAAALIAEGVIAAPQIIRWSSYAHLSPANPYYHTAWRQNPAHPGGYISDGGVHHMAVLRMLGGEVETVTAQAAQLRPDLPPCDTLHASLKFAGGATGAYSVSYAYPGPETPVQVIGQAGALLVRRDGVELWREGAVVRTWAQTADNDGLTPMYADFAHAIHAGVPPVSTAAQGYADLQLIVALLQAAERQQMVRVADVVA